MRPKFSNENFHSLCPLVTKLRSEFGGLSTNCKEFTDSSKKDCGFAICGLSYNRPLVVHSFYSIVFHNREFNGRIEEYRVRSVITYFVGYHN